MYNYKFYEEMDDLMVTLLSNLAITFVYALLYAVLYVLVQPIRLVKYIWYRIQLERACNRAEAIRFENLKRTGHI